MHPSRICRSQKRLPLPSNKKSFGKKYRGPSAAERNPQMPFFADQSREQLRRLYVDTWRKFRTNKPLEPLEAQLAELIAEHPEYHAILEVEDSTAAEFSVEAGRENPFLHLGLHLAIREQVATDRPAGIAAAHSALARKLGSVHEAEHRI